MARDLSIVIPTHNRKDILIKALEAYCSQTAADQILEILVIDDGSNDGTKEAVQQAGFAQRLSLRHIWQESRGQASARNRGIHEARGNIILFTDDDIIPCPRLVAEHRSWHGAYPALSDAVLGHVAWAPELNPNPFMEWLGKDGVVTGYAHFHRGKLDEPIFYSGNISLKRDFLLQNGMFDEEFRSYGFEDGELGYRLGKKGLRVFYNPDAAGYHYKRMSLADVSRRAEFVVANYKLFKAKTSEGNRPDPVPHRSLPRRVLRTSVRAGLRLVAPAARLFDTQIPFPWIVYSVFYNHYVLPKARLRVASRAGRPQDSEGSHVA